MESRRPTAEDLPGGGFLTSARAWVWPILVSQLKICFHNNIDVWV